MNGENFEITQYADIFYCCSEVKEKRKEYGRKKGRG
jgi:hypothetical protein